MPDEILTMNGHSYRRLVFVPKNQRGDLDLKTIQAKTGCRKCHGRGHTAWNSTLKCPVLCDCVLIEVGLEKPTEEING